MNPFWIGIEAKQSENEKKNSEQRKQENETNTHKFIQVTVYARKEKNFKVI